MGRTVIANMLGLNRVDLKKVPPYFLYRIPPVLRLHSQLINATEVNPLLPEILVLGDLVNNLYAFHYNNFFVALGVFFRSSLSTPRLSRFPPLPETLEQIHLNCSRLLSSYARFCTRKMYILTCTQLLESHRNLTLDNLCSAFGVGLRRQVFSVVVHLLSLSDRIFL